MNNKENPQVKHYPEDLRDFSQQLLQWSEAIDSHLKQNGLHPLSSLFKEKEGRVYCQYDMVPKFLFLPGGEAYPKRINFKKTIAGLYLFAEEQQPVYVGISRNILSRLRQHAFSKSHFSASLAYLMVNHQYTGGKASTTRKDHQHFNDDGIREGIQKQIRGWDVIIIPEENPYRRYMLEGYLAGYFKTIWNSFETH